MKLPDFLCVGAAKSGTTSLHEILSGHKEIFLPERKEIHFFENDENFNQGKEWYQQYFQNVKSEKIIGEITADYMFYDYVPQRIAGTLGSDIKLIYMLRDPVDRAFSEYLFNVRRGYFNGTFLQAIENEKQYDPKKFASRYFTHLNRSMYSFHLAEMNKVFRNQDKNFFIIFEEDFKKNKATTFSNLLDFLEVSQQNLELDQVYKPAYVPRFQAIQKLVFAPSKFKKFVKQFLPSYKLRRKIKDQLLPAINKSSAKVEKLDENVRYDLIKNVFYDDIMRTQDLVKRDLTIWLK